MTEISLVLFALHAAARECRAHSFDIKA